MLTIRMPFYFIYWSIFLEYITTSFRLTYSRSGISCLPKYTNLQGNVAVWAFSMQDGVNEEWSNTSDASTSNPMSYMYKKTGWDERFPISYKEPNATEILYNISVHIRKLSLLTLLQNDRVSVQDKISRIEAETDYSILPSIHAGGLFRDWEVL